MASKVYFTPLNVDSGANNLLNRLNRLLEKSGIAEVIHQKDLCAIKVHFGEYGNETFIPPWDLEPIIKLIKSKGAHPFITDTNTLYLGSRKNSVSHLKTAIRHGYSYATTGVPIIIADGLTGNNRRNVQIDKKHFKSVKIAGDIHDADSMIVVSHFKGHMMAGFGGAIKNLAMGCAPAAGKREQHSARPESDHVLCTGCGTCVGVCPEDTIEMIDGKSVIHSEGCIGCGECIVNCPEKAINLNWQTEIPEFIERMVEYAYGAYHPKKNRIGFVNFVMNVTPDCDCLNWSEPAIIQDVGILISTDPLALDRACYDLVNQQRGNPNTKLASNFSPGEDKFKGVHAELDGEIQFSYGESIGLGIADYELITVE